MCASAQGTAVIWDENWIFIMTGKDYQADLEHGDPFVDQKLEGIHIFNTVKQGLRDHVIFLQIQFGEKTS